MREQWRPRHGRGSLSAKNVSHVFAAHRTGADPARARQCRCRYPARRNGRVHRSERMRQEHLAECDRRTDRSDARRSLYRQTAGEGPAPKKVAYIFQESALLPGRAFWTTSRSGSNSRASPPPRRTPRAESALAAVGLTPFARHYPHQLSGGMKQRVALSARAEPGDRHPADG